MKLSVVSLSLCLFTASLFADDTSAQVKLSQAQALYEARVNPANVEQGLSLASAAESEAADAELKYEAIILQSKFLYFKGTHTQGDGNKVALFDSGYKKGLAARQLNEEYADGFYWSAVNLSRWGEANGVLSSLSKKKEVMDTLEVIFEKNSHDGQLGENYEYNGADRILGRLYFKLPGFAGGSQAKSLKHLENAYKNAKECVLNINYYAETLSGGSAAEKQRAREILDTLLQNDPKTYNPKRMPETEEEFVDAKKLRSELGS